MAGAHRHDLRTAGHLAGTEPAGLNRDLVRGELWVHRRILSARRPRAGLQVDHDEPALRVALESVDAAAYLHQAPGRAFGRGEPDVEVLLDGHLLARVA